MSRLIRLPTKRDVLRAMTLTALPLPGLSLMGMGRPAKAPVDVPDPKGALITRWRQDPLAYGSYSFLAKGARPEHRAWLAEPVGGRLFFAGEATSSNHPSTVHGAHLSGLRAAEEALASGAELIAIIGAGMAGLSAAQNLSANGRNVTVYEARARTGGRVLSDRSLGTTVDLGASWIHGTRNNPLTQLAARAGAQTVVTDLYRVRIYDQDGKRRRIWQISKDARDILFRENSWGADVADFSEHIDEDGEEFGGPEVIFPDGYDQVFSVLGGGYETQLSATVSAVSLIEDGVRLSVNGAETEFDAAIITLPLGVLKAGTVAFDPPLPARKQEAIDTIGMGLLNKVVLQFDTPFWPDDAAAFGYLGPKRGQFASWLNLSRFTGAPMLMAFNAGSAADALEAETDETLIEGAMSALRTMFGT